jgi:hypothetical protein
MNIVPNLEQKVVKK